MNPCINVTLDCVSALFSLMILFYLRIGTDRKDKLNCLFSWLCVCNLGMLLSDPPNWLCEGFAKPWYPSALQIGMFVQYLFGCLAPWVYSLYLYTYLSHKTQMKKWIIFTIHGMFIVDIALLILNYINQMYYYIDRFNIYQRGELYWMSQAIPVLILVFDASIVVYYRKTLRNKDIFAFLSYLFIPIIGIILQTKMYGITTTYLACTISLFMMFLCVQSEQQLLLEQQQRNLDKAHLLVVLSQIQPHFLYNALLGIKQLCDTQPQKASRALEHFSYYLRGNLYAISDPQLIPFQKEVEHVQDYLYLEKMRFEERLDVTWDLQYVDFMLPPLTLQPIVENSIRHGITKKEAPGTLTIRSEQIDKNILITVIDDGVGFDTTKPSGDDRPHIGIQNARTRLEVQCSGSLHIQSAPGKGTKVTIILPQMPHV